MTLRQKRDAIGRGIVRYLKPADEDPEYNAETGYVTDNAGRVAKLYVSGSRIYVDLKAVEARRANGESLKAIARDLGVSPVLLVKRTKLTA